MCRSSTCLEPLASIKRSWLKANDVGSRSQPTTEERLHFPPSMVPILLKFVSKAHGAKNACTSMNSEV